MPPTNAGALQVEYITKDITSLTNAGNEPFSTWTDESGIDRPEVVEVVGAEEDAQVLIPDHINDQFHVVDHTGSDVAAGTDIGEVKVRIEGRN